MKKVNTDICIVGTGFSGTFVAHQLKGTSARILFVEKGAYISRDRIENNYISREPFADTNSVDEQYRLLYDDPVFHLYAHENSGRDVYKYSGYHAFGGNSLVWYGNTLRKVPNDFHTKSAYGIGIDWPVTCEDLLEYYYQAEVEMAVCGPEKDIFTPYRKRPFPLEAFALPPGAHVLNSLFSDSNFHITPGPKARLPVDYGNRTACCGAGTCTVYCPADARYSCLTTHLHELQKAGRVDLLDKVTISRLVQKGDRIVEAVGFDRKGDQVRITADVFILAANAVENARILLLSQYHPQTGFKTRSNAIGRYLSDQVGILISARLPVNLYRGYEKTVQSSNSLSFYDGPFRSRYSGTVVEIGLNVLPAYLDPKTITDNAAAGRLVLDAVKKGYYGKALQKHICMETLGDVGFMLQMEMLPDFSNHVRLHKTKKDQYGDPIADFCFSIWNQPYVQRSIEHYSAVFKKMVEREGGRADHIFKRSSFDHMLGTCRMGRDPADSVVDSDMKSHDHANLYIVGGSAFPTAGITNPTLTIAALALRCGAYIRDQIET